MPLTKGVSLETGQLGILVPPGEGYKVTSPAQREAYVKHILPKQIHKFREGPSFTFFDKETISTVEKLPDKHCGYLLILQTCQRRN